MDHRPEQRRRVGRLAISSIVAVGLFASMLAASAASLGVTGGSLFSQEIEVSIPASDEPIVSTDFSTCSNFIDGWVDELGNTWTSHSGNWQCLGSGVVRAQQRVPMANLTVGITENTDLLVITEISDISQQNNRSGPGLSLLANGSGDYIYVLYERDSERLLIGVTGATPTSYDNVGDLESATLSATIAGGALTVDFTGQPSIMYLIPSGFNIPWFGLVSDDDNQSRFTSFTIEDLS